VPSEIAGIHVADPLNAEPVEHTLKRLFLRGGDGLDQVVRRHLAETLELRELVGCQRVQVRGISDQVLRQKAADVLFTQAIDVHRPDEMLDGLEDLSRTTRPIRADGPHTALRFDGWGVAHRTGVRR
jgi:hypothetical protein